MAKTTAKATLLNAELAAFIQGGLAIDAVTRDGRNFPRAARVIACSVPPDRRQLRLILSPYGLDHFLEALKETRAIAAVFCLASTHRAVQIKGSDARIEAIRKGDRQLALRTMRAFAADIVAIGLDEVLVPIETNYDPDAMITIVFSPNAIYEHTPGPTAGSCIGTR